MNKIKAILAVVVRFIVGLFKEQKEEEEKGVDRIQLVLSQFEDGVLSLKIGLAEISDEDNDVIGQIQELEGQRAVLSDSSARAEKLLDGLKALLGE
jgi:hypothetical protein